jgi:hypothetical protein
VVGQLGGHRLAGGPSGLFFLVTAVILLPEPAGGSDPSRPACSRSPPEGANHPGRRAGWFGGHHDANQSADSYGWLGGFNSGGRSSRKKSFRQALVSVLWWVLILFVAALVPRWLGS